LLSGIDTVTFYHLVELGDRHGREIKAELHAEQSAEVGAAGRPEAA
jgi:hypothetical protein